MAWNSFTREVVENGIVPSTRWTLPATYESTLRIPYAQTTRRREGPLPAPLSSGGRCIRIAIGDAPFYGAVDAGTAISPSDASRWMWRGSSANLSARSRCCLASSTPNISAIDLRYSCGEKVALDLTDVDMCCASTRAHVRKHGGTADETGWMENQEARTRASRSRCARTSTTSSTKTSSPSSRLDQRPCDLPPTEPTDVLDFAGGGFLTG